jgi:hypothetical protein
MIISAMIAGPFSKSKPPWLKKKRGWILPVQHVVANSCNNLSGPWPYPWAPLKVLLLQPCRVVKIMFAPVGAVTTVVLADVINAFN